jgi:3-dehydroquinate synthase
LHGEAVSIGLYCAARLSYELGYLDKSQLVLIDSLLASALLPRRIPKEIDLGKLQNLMFNDKKILNNKLRFVLIRAPGNCFIEPEITADSLRCVLMNVVEGEQP